MRIYFVVAQPNVENTRPFCKSGQKKKLKWSSLSVGVSTDTIPELTFVCLWREFCVLLKLHFRCPTLDKIASLATDEEDLILAVLIQHSLQILCQKGELWNSGPQLPS